MNNKRCIGCGSILQFKDINKEGYVKETVYDSALVCERCFRIKNYGDYKIINKDKKYYEKVFNETHRNGA